MPDPTPTERYRGIPSLAGLGDLRSAMTPGLSVERCVGRLKRYHYAFKRLHHAMTARLCAEPIYELKTAFSHHSYLCAEHVAALRARVAEMREPPLGLDKVPDDDLAIYFDEILNAPDSEALVVGIYEKALPALRDGMRRHIAETNPLADAPSVRVCRFALLEAEDMIAFGDKAIAAIVTDEHRAAMADWLNLLDRCLAAAGGLDGADEHTGETIARMHSATPYKYDAVPKRDERFIDKYNAGVNAEALLYDEKMPPSAKTLAMFYKRIRELDVPEMMSSIITQTPDKPWGYYLEMSRQLWDEARHAMMGEVGLTSLNIDWTAIPINFTWSLNLNTQCSPLEAHGVLYFIEQGLMPKTGKRYEWEVGVESGDPLSGVFQDYDWADEVLHAAIGRRWYIPQFDSSKEAIAFGDEAWSRVVSHYREYLDKGLTEHRNWWPEIYKQACEHWGVDPDEKVAGFDTTYEDIRADLKSVTGSG